DHQPECNREDQGGGVQELPQDPGNDPTGAEKSGLQVVRSGHRPGAGSDDETGQPRQGGTEKQVKVRRGGQTMLPGLGRGTRNRKKREEIVEILGDLGLDLRDLTSWPDAPEVVEDGDTFEANARKKAMELARHLHHWTLGEDSGLVVPALNGRPGVYSARYAGKQG